jgi:uncharacterized membrane protein YfcA
MNHGQLIKKIALHTCIYYTAASFVVLLFYWMLNINHVYGLQPLAQLCLLPFALVFAAANIYLTQRKQQTALKVLLHYVLVVGATFLCLYLPNRPKETNPSSGLIMFLFFTLLYALIMAIVGYIRSRTRRVERERKSYTGVYKKK